MKQSDLKDQSAVPEGAKAHKFDDVITVIGTEKAVYLKAGKKYQLHRLQAETLIKKGEAKKDA